MTLKKVKVINVVVFFALSFLWHFVYDLLPNFFTAIFFPVNESLVLPMEFVELLVCLL